LFVDVSFLVQAPVGRIHRQTAVRISS
jgi:hypothetical protein